MGSGSGGGEAAMIVVWVVLAVLALPLRPPGRRNYPSSDDAGNPSERRQARWLANAPRLATRGSLWPSR